MIKRKSVTQLKVYDKNIKKRRLEKPEKQNKHAVSATLSHERDGTSTSTSFDSLPNEILLAIFRKLPIASRLSVERVCNRWKQLILDQGWNKFYYFDDDFFMEAKKDVIFRKSKHGKNFLQNHVLPHDKEKWRISNEELQTLFRRTASNLRCINLWGIEVDSSICKLFSQRLYMDIDPINLTSKVFQFPNLNSLYLPGIHLNSENLEILARAFPRLELILLSMLGEDSANGLTVLLKKLSHLRDFIIEGCFDCFFDYEFQCLPNSLRRIQVDDVISLPQLISKAVDQCPQLECFIHQYGASELGVLEFERISRFKCLKFLEITLDMENKPYFLGALESLSFLQALNLDSWDRCIDSEVLSQIAQKSVKLEHLNVGLSYSTQIVQTGLNELRRMPMLTSLEIVFWKQKEKIKIPLEFLDHFKQFLENLCSKGKLKYFCTNAQVAMKTICNALVKCKNLTQLAWGYNRLQYKMLFETLDHIHGKQLPTCSKDPRILKVKTPKINKDAPTHAWVVFSDYLNNNLLEDYY